MIAALNGHVDLPAALAALPSPAADEAFVDLACHLAEGCATCRGAVDSLPDSAFPALPLPSIAAALWRLRNTSSWAALSSDHFTAAVEARSGGRWGAFAFLVVEEALSLVLSDASSPAEAFDQVLLLGVRLAERHPDQPRVSALRSKACADLVSIFCACDDEAAADKAFRQALEHVREHAADREMQLPVHEAMEVLARHRKDTKGAWNHLVKVAELTGSDSPLRAFEVAVEIVVRLAKKGETSRTIENLLYSGFAKLEPLRTAAEPIVRAHVIYRQARLIAVLSHRLAAYRPALSLPVLQAADALAEADDLFKVHTDGRTQGLRLLLLGQLWKISGSDRAEGAFFAALEIFEEVGEAAFTEEARAALFELMKEVSGGTVH